jgi:addiction module HigA family antidote
MLLWLMKYRSIMTTKRKIPAHQLIAGDVFHPGEFVLNELEAREMKQVELAEKLDMSKSEINLLVHGKRNITVPIAIKLEKVFRISAETWMNLQMRYEIELVKKRIQLELTQAKISTKKKSSMKTALTTHTK